jgi:predicted DNA-binding transcriptional regulator YafY
MAQNKNALIRYKTIDKCLQNHESTWSLDDLISECSKVLSTVENKEIVISKRSVQLDIQMMRSAEVGYNAPIEVYERKYYRYTDDQFSITKLPITNNDKKLLLESLDVISQFEDFNFYEELKGYVSELQKLIVEEGIEKQVGKAEKIILEIDKSKKEKLLNKPLHKSQEIKKEKKNGNVVLQFKIENTFKFQKKILQLGKDVKVISPKHFKKSLKKAAQFSGK